MDELQQQPVNKSTPRTMPAATPQKGRRQYRSSGLYTLKRAVKELGGRAIDRRYTVGKALVKWRDEIVADLGGNLSTSQLEIVDVAVRTKLILSSVDVWIIQQKSLVNARKRSLIPVARERTQLADSLVKYLTLLGLKRIAKGTELAPWDIADPEHDGDGNGTAPGPQDKVNGKESEQ